MCESFCLIHFFSFLLSSAALSIHLPLQTAVHECDIRYNFHHCAHFPHCSLTKVLQDLNIFHFLLLHMKKHLLFSISPFIISFFKIFVQSFFCNNFVCYKHFLSSIRFVDKKLFTYKFLLYKIILENIIFSINVLSSSKFDIITFSL